MAANKKIVKRVRKRKNRSAGKKRKRAIRVRGTTPSAANLVKKA